MVATAIYSVTMVLWKETAFPLCRVLLWWRCRTTAAGPLYNVSVTPVVNLQRNTPLESVFIELKDWSHSALTPFWRSRQDNSSIWQVHVYEIRLVYSSMWMWWYSSRVSDDWWLSLWWLMIIADEISQYHLLVWITGGSTSYYCRAWYRYSMLWRMGLL